MLLRLPHGLLYPITVTSLLKQHGDPVERDEALFWYVYQTTVTEGDGLGNKYEVKRSFPTKFESSVDGEIVQWKIKKGDVIEQPYVISVFEIILFRIGAPEWRLLTALRVGLTLSRSMNHVPTKFNSADSARNAGRI